MVSAVSNQRIQPDAFSKAVIGVLDSYSEEVAANIKKAVDATTRELVKETKQTAPKKAIMGRPAGTFAKHISSKLGRSTNTVYSKIWYVRSPEYRLAHLLNNGHALRQGGYWGGTGFLTKAANNQALSFERRVKEAIVRAGR